MSERKNRFENTALAVGLGTLLTGASYGLFCYLKSRNEAQSHYSDQPRQKTKNSCTDDTCPICIDVMSSKCMTCPCQHSFHKKCIIQWQSISKTCPVCRSPLKER